MQALLLSAGLGTRLKPLTHHFPKCLTPIQGRPLLGIWLETLVNAGVKKIFINLHYMPELVFEYVADTPYAKYVEWLYEPSLLGTAGTLSQFLNKFSRGPLLLIHADNLSQFPLQSMWQAHLHAKPSVDMTMMTFTTDNPSSCGIVEQNPQGNIIAFHEKVNNPPGTCANAAVYVLSSKLVKNLGSNITDFSTQVVEANLNSTQTWHNSYCHRDIGTLDSLLLAPGDIVTKLTSPVTGYWRQYWNKGKWQRLYQVAEELAFELKLPILTQYEIPERPLAAVMVIESFNEERWFNCISFLEPDKSIILIGDGCPQVIENILGSKFRRYILFVATVNKAYSSR